MKFNDKNLRALYLHFKKHLDRLPEEQKHLFMTIDIAKADHPKQNPHDGEWFKMTFAYPVGERIEQTFFIGHTAKKYWLIIETTGQLVLAAPEIGTPQNGKRYFYNNADHLFIFDLANETLEQFFQEVKSYLYQDIFADMLVPAAGRSLRKATDLRDNSWNKSLPILFPLSPIFIAGSIALTWHRYSLQTGIAGLIVFALCLIITMKLLNESARQLRPHAVLLRTRKVYLKRNIAISMLSAFLIGTAFLLASISSFCLS